VWRFAEEDARPEQVRGRLKWHPVEASGGLVIDLGEILAPL
jgi:hypothetical protein